MIIFILLISFLFTTPHLLAEAPFVTRGKASILSTDISPGCQGSRPAALGTFVGPNNNTILVPADTRFTNAKRFHDLYNQCASITPTNISQVNIESMEITTIDPDGEIITGYILCDNYCELYINGILIGTDPVPFTPFNSVIARFRVKKPYTIAIQAVDWEELPGLGSENNNGNPYHAGDGGIIAVFSDGTVTDASWKSQVYYISPITSPDSVQTTSDNTRFTYQTPRNISCGDSCYAVHYPIPANWMNQGFDDSDWPKAVVYAPSTVGVNFPAWTNFTSLWGKNQFIWTSNLIVDNLVLLRKEVLGSTHALDDMLDIPSFDIQFQDQFIRIASSSTHSNVNVHLYSVLGENLGSYSIPHLERNTPTEITMNPPKGNYLVMMMLESQGIPLFFKQCIMSY
ncbi:MAG: hypothetical protein ACO3GR_08165 [Candidatus Kapaibacteriota bacterium]